MKRALAVVAIAALALAGSGCNWFKSMGRKDNVEPPTPLLEFAPTLQVERLWSASVGDGAGLSGARMTPAVGADGRVYAVSIDGSIEAFDGASGRSAWRKRLGGSRGFLWKRGEHSMRWSGGPAIDGDLLVVGGLDGQVIALSAADGGERWQTRIESEVISTPAIGGGLVVVRGNDGRLQALDANDGSRKWVFDQSVPALSLRGNSAPLIANGVVYDGTDGGRVSAVRLDDGNELWTQTLSTGEGRTEVERLADVDGNISSDGSALFAVGYRGQIAALALDSGRPLWQRDLSSYASVALAGTTAVAIDSDGNVWAFDRDTGANLWKQDQLKYRWLSAPAIQGNQVVVGDSEGYVHWLSLAEGKFVARERLGKQPIEAAPVVAGDVAYVQDIGGRLGAYRIRP
ncbi:MAG: outer membrane protein assembly factor BamB [Xanthomonadales bacterium]|nr:outer membrane protein assembly factor BamB [Xanthomonadales bacterium]MCC6595829.1 outer membrane protein assembly factor BamB [Rhodanobacteraceae bacterium]MDL1868635.1 outer membrane protein assembly factor BamB [Gammaproteobacteria bacterium PRO6]